MKPSYSTRAAVLSLLLLLVVLQAGCGSSDMIDVTDDSGQPQGPELPALNPTVFIAAIGQTELHSNGQITGYDPDQDRSAPIQAYEHSTISAVRFLGSRAYVGVRDDHLLDVFDAASFELVASVTF